MTLDKATVDAAPLSPLQGKPAGWTYGYSSTTTPRNTTGESSIMPPPQSKPARATTSDSAIMPPPQSKPARATTSDSAIMPPPQSKSARAATSDSAIMPPPQSKPARATTSDSAIMPPPQSKPARATTSDSAIMPPPQSKSARAATSDSAIMPPPQSATTDGSIVAVESPVTTGSFYGMFTYSGVKNPTLEQKKFAIARVLRCECKRDKYRIMTVMTPMGHGRLLNSRYHAVHHEDPQFEILVHRSMFLGVGEIKFVEGELMLCCFLIIFIPFIFSEVQWHSTLLRANRRY
jgi:hypothetical protein